MNTLGAYVSGLGSGHSSGWRHVQISKKKSNTNGDNRDMLIYKGPGRKAVYTTPQIPS
jgi:hypothetical protein